MVNPLEKLKKMRGRSWAEIRTRSEQALSAYGEQIGLRGKMPADREFAELLIPASGRNDTPTTIENLFLRFYENAEYSFFPAFRRDTPLVEDYLELFGRENARRFIDRAERIIRGKIDLLGYRELEIGRDPDWHLEPISGKRSPLRHWKAFDELSTDETGDKKIIWELNRHQHFFTLGLAYGFTGDPRYAKTFAGHLAGWMEQNPPEMGINWMSSLEVAFRAVSWIWALNLFRNAEEELRPHFLEALKFLYCHGRHIEKYLSTYYSPNTHLTGEALGLYYLGTQLPFFRRAAKWRELGEKILFAELDRQIYPDGGYFEQSTWYHRYTTDFYTHFFILKFLSGNRGERFQRSKLNSRLQALLTFLMHLTRPDGTTPLIGDDDGGKMLPEDLAPPDDFRASLATGAVLFERGDLKFVAEEFAEETYWLLGRDGFEKFTEIRPHLPAQRSFAFEKSGYFVMRDGWANTDSYLLVDCGELGSLKGGHGHADALAIDLTVAGRSFLIDPGTYCYHGADDARDLFRTTIAHNTLVIDERSQSEPGGKFSWKTMAETRLENWIAEDRFDFFSGAHTGYRRLENGPAEHLRSILFIKGDYWIMRDSVETAGEHTYALNFHFDDGIDPRIGKTEAGTVFLDSMTENDIGLRIFAFGAAGRWEIGDGYLSKCFGSRRQAAFPRYLSGGMVPGAQEFFTFLMPSEKDLFAPPLVAEAAHRNGRIFTIEFGDYRDTFVVSTDAAGGRVRTEHYDTNFRFFWSRCGRGESVPEEFVMIGGTRFSLGGVEIINYRKELSFAVARRLGNRLNLRTPDNILTVTLLEDNFSE